MTYFSITFATDAAVDRFRFGARFRMESPDLITLSLPADATVYFADCRLESIPRKLNLDARVCAQI